MAASHTVSIIVPAYDAETTIAEALESVCAQTYLHWEAIVVDDGSTDATATVADTFARRDARIRVVRQANAGEAAARNRGIAHARHEWLLFLDADDWIAPTHLERLTAELRADPELDAVHCGTVRVARDGTLVAEGYQAPAGDLFPILAVRAAFPVHACLVRRSVVDAAGRFDPSFKKSADWDLWQRVARMGARFGAVSDVLAYYRMQPQSASLESDRLLIDGMRVLRQGHAADPRVEHPHPLHAGGAAPAAIGCQQFYLLCWCAGLLLGQRRDARSLFEFISDADCPTLDAEAIARCLFESATLPTCETPQAWEALWNDVGPRVNEFLEVLESRSGTADLARSSVVALKTMILRTSPRWSAVIDRLDEHAAEARARTDERVREVEQLQTTRAAVEAAHEELREALTRTQDELAALDARTARLARELAEATQQIDVLRAANASLIEQRTASERLAADRQAALEALTQQPWTRLGRRVHLLHEPGTSILPPRLAAAAARLFFRVQLFRLRIDRVLARLTRPTRQRVLATACWQFPIYSQTFVYQELTQLSRSGRAVRFLYGERNRRDPLPEQFRPVWRGRRQLVVHPDVCRVSYEHFARIAPDRVESLIDLLSRESGLAADEIRGHYHVAQAFAFARMVEAYRPDYLHSYFFYEGTLFTFVASHLLGIPRGVSCYADHMLQDYALKVVPLHLRQCSVIIATSERIKRELLSIEPGCGDRILVKPNGINVASFPLVRRDGHESRPFRLVSVSRIESKKGLLYLVDAVGQLRDRGIALVLHIIGGVDDSASSRAYSQELIQRISALGLEDVVRLEGRKSEREISEFFQRSHLFVAPYIETDTGDKDGIPTAMLEAMSTGLAIVATDGGSIGEVIRDGQDGLLVPQKNPEALAAAVAGLLHDQERRAAIGASAARRVRETFEAARCERVLHERLDRLQAVS